jgi:hypothetical protein
MTGSSGNPAWARTWQPPTKNDARSFQLYGDPTISAIATGLPEGVDQVELPGFIRQWASQQIAMGRASREASPDTAADRQPCRSHLAGFRHVFAGRR